MKKIYSILLTALAVLAFAPAASAQYTIDDFIKGKYGSSASISFPKDNGVKFPEGKDFAYSKNISSPFNDGVYYIKLESFATGAGDIVDKPADIVLVLDVSGSMRNNYGNTTGMYPFGSTGSTYNQGYCPDHFQTNGAQAGTSYKWEGEYYPIYEYKLDHGQGTNPRYDYGIYFDDGNGVRHWLWETGVVDEWPELHAGNTKIYWGMLWKQKRKSRLDELKEAVKEFIDIIQDNDLNFIDENGNKYPREHALGNKISIVKFAHSYYTNGSNVMTNTTLDVGNHVGAADVKAYNYTELVINMTSVATDTGKQALYDAVDGLIEGGHTAADFGTQLANAVLNQASVKDRDSNKTVVLFTDGDPNHNDGFITSVANATINNANTSKTTHKAKVFAVAVFDEENDNRRDYMNRVSSNYKDATSMTTGTLITPASKRVFYQNAADGNLKEVFANIAKQAGGSGSVLSAAASNVDVVSNSFILPEGTNSQNIGDRVKVFTAPLTDIDDDGKYIFGTETLAGHATDTYQVLDEDGEVIGTYKVDEVPNPSGSTPATLPITVGLQGTNEISVTNFDYGNNWCGPIKNQAHQVIGYHGHKIIILIPIKMNPDAVGGPNVETNEEGSGIYSNNQPYVEFKSPTVSLPVNIHIEKAGLVGVESAKFMIEKAVLRDLEGDDDEYTLEYITSIPEENWKYVTTVFVTNSENAQHVNPDGTGNPVVRVKGLPSEEEVDGVKKGLVYRVHEENWSWAYGNEDGYMYTVTGQMNNPFTFTNSKTTGIDTKIKHSESKVTNVFVPKSTGSDKGKVIYDDLKQNERD